MDSISGRGFALMWDWVAGAVGGDLSPKPADREGQRDRESRQFKREIERAQLARLDVLNEFSGESHGVKSMASGTTMDTAEYG
jgi:hypothetical protein